MNNSLLYFFFSKVFLYIVFVFVNNTFCSEKILGNIILYLVEEWASHYYNLGLNHLFPRYLQ